MITVLAVSPLQERRRCRTKNREKNQESNGDSSTSNSSGSSSGPMDPPATAYFGGQPRSPFADSSSDDASSASSKRSLPMITADEPVLLVPSILTPPTSSSTPSQAQATAHSVASSNTDWRQEQQLLRQENTLLRQRIELQEHLARQRSAQLQGCSTTQEDSELGMLYSTMPLSQSPPTITMVQEAQHDVELYNDRPQPPLAQDPHRTIVDTTMNSSALPPITPQDEKKRTPPSRAQCSLLLVTCILIMLALLVLVLGMVGTGRRAVVATPAATTPTAAPVATSATAAEETCLDFPVSSTTRISNVPMPVSSLPTCLGQLTLLTHLALPSGELTGTLPSELGQLTLLTWLAFPTNRLTGTLPQTLSRLTRLEWFSVRNNELEGTLPDAWTTSMTALTRLNVRNNRLTGTIPAVWKEELEEGDEPAFIFDGNNFTQTVLPKEETEGTTTTIVVVQWPTDERGEENGDSSNSGTSTSEAAGFGEQVILPSMDGANLRDNEDD